MKASNLALLAVLIWPSTAVHPQKENTCPSSTGIFGHFINKTLESLRPDLADLYIKSKDFETGHQEFGSLLGIFREVRVEGLENFYVKTLHTSGLDITNLTVVEENFNAKGLYGINGSMVFPLGKSDIHLYGDGNFGAKFSNLSVSVKMKIRFRNGTKVVEEFDMIVGFKKIEITDVTDYYSPPCKSQGAPSQIRNTNFADLGRDQPKKQVYFKNLMGGGDLEEAFNQIINLVALPVFDYYKETVLDTFKLQVIEFLNKILSGKYEEFRHVFENNLYCSS